MRSTYYVCLLVVCLLIEGPAVYAQTYSPERIKTAFASGCWQVGLRDGYGRGDLFSHHNSLQAHAEYCVVDQLMVGIGVNWSKEWHGSIGFDELTVGPLVRYQFTRTRFSPFIEASYQFGQRNSELNSIIRHPSLSMQSILVNPGLSIEVMRSLRLDISYGFQRLVNDYASLYGQPQLGINYLFGSN